MINHGSSVRELRAKFPAEYNVWAGMNQRCRCKTAHNYSRYGGRGIDVFPEWRGDSPNAFAKFLEYVTPNLGPRCDGCSLDRIENNKGYYPGNIKWSSRLEQCNNRQRNRWVTFKGQELTLTQFSKLIGLAGRVETVRLALGRGEAPEHIAERLGEAE